MQRTHFQGHGYMALSQVIWMLGQPCFFGYGCLISCKSKEQGKRNDPCRWEADVTPLSCSLFRVKEPYQEGS